MTALLPFRKEEYVKNLYFYVEKNTLTWPLLTFLLFQKTIICFFRFHVPPHYSVFICCSSDSV